MRKWEELTPLEQAHLEWWDMYKEAYGVRPRYINTEGWTMKDYQKEFKHLEWVISTDSDGK